MANNDGKLWFEMGVRDKVTGAMKTAIDEAVRLGYSIDAATKNVEALKRALYKINEVSSRASSAISKGLELGLDTSKLQEGLNKLKSFEQKLMDLQKGGRLATEKDVLKGFLGADYQAMLRTMSKVTAEQERMNASQIKSSERQAEQLFRNRENVKKILFDIQMLSMQAEVAVKNGISLNIDTSKLESAIQKIKLFEQKLRALKDEDISSKNVKNILGSEYEIAYKNLQRLVGEQQKLNTLRSRSNSRNSDIELRNTEAWERSLHRLMKLYSRISESSNQAQKLGIDTSKIKEAFDMYDILTNKLMSLRKYEGLATDKNFIRKYLGEDFQHNLYFIKKIIDAQNKLNSAKEKENRISSARAKSEELRARQAQLEVNERLISSYNRVSNAMSQQSRVASQLRNVMSDYLSIYTGANILRSIITTGGEFETQRIAMQTLLGDLREGQQIYNQIQSLAIVSPESFLDLAKYTKQLAAFNIPYNELYDTTKRIVDISAGLGVDPARIILAYGQVRSSTVLRGQELRQFTEAGIPMVDALAKKFSELNGRMVTSADILNKLIPTRQVPFEMVKEVLEDMTNEGGRFYNMQFVLADTLAGKWSNLRDAWEVMLSGIADGRTVTGQFFKIAVSGATELIKSLDSLLPVIGGVITSFVLRKGLNIGKAFFTPNISSVVNDYLKAKDIEAQRLMRKSMTQELSDGERRILETRKLMTAEDYKLLATSGKLNVNQLSYLYGQKKINAELLNQLVKANAITAAEQKRIMSGRTMLTILKQQTTALGGMFKSLLKDPFVWLTAIISAIFEINSAVSETENMMNSAMESAAQRFTALSNTLKEIREAGKPQNTDAYEQSNQTMLSSLKETSWNYDEIEKTAAGIEDLNSKYNYLNETLKQTMEAYKWLSENSGVIGGLLDTTGGLQTSKGFWGAVGSALTFDWLSDDLGENMDDWDEYNTQLQATAISLNKYAPQINDAINSIIKSSPELKKSLDGKSMEEQLKIIVDSGYWGALVNKMGIWSLSAKETTDAWKEAYEDFHASNKEVEKDAETMAKGIAAVLDKTAKGRGQTLRQYVKENETLVATLVDNIVRAFNIGSEKIQNKVIDSIRVWLGLAREYDNMGNRLKTKPLTPYQLQTGLGKQMLTNVVKKYGQGVVSVAEINSIAGTVKSPKDVSAALDELKKKVQDLKSNYDSFNAVFHENSKYTQDAKKELEKYTKVAIANGLTMDDLYKKQKYGYTKSKRGDKEDVWLKDMNARFSLLEKYLSLYEKMKDTLGSEDAKNKVMNDTQFASLKDVGITDPTDRVAAYQKIYEIYNSNATTAERKRKTEEVLAKLYNEQAEALVKQNQVLNEISTTTLDKLNKQWDIYKKWMDATGDRGMSAQIAFGRDTGYTNFAEQLRDELSKRTDVIKAGGIDVVMKMTSTQLDELFGKAGQNADGAREKINALKEATKTWNDEMLDNLLEVIKNNKDYVTQLDDITRKLNEQVKLINSQTFSGDPETNAAIRQKYINEANKEAQRQRGEVLFKQFQEESDWVAIFDDLDRVSTETITTMIDKIDKFAKTAGLSVETVKKLREALSKLKDENLQRDPFGGLARSLSRSNAIRAYLKGGLGEINTKDGRYILNDFQARRMGLMTGGTGYKSIDLQNEMQGAEADVIKSIENIRNTFDDLQNVLNPVINLLSSLGIDLSDLSDALEITGTALSTATSTGTSFQNLMNLSAGKGNLGELLGIENAGIWGAAAGAGLSILTSLFQAHDKALQEEIEASQERQKEMENTSNNLTRILERHMGGVYTFKASADDLKDFNKYFEKYRLTGQYQYGYIQEDTRNRITEAQKSKSYYDSYLASLMVQRDELQHQIDSERDKKNSDSGKIEDMQQQYEELADQIKYVAEDMAKELYGIDFKSWASELSQILVDAWASGTDAAEAYKNKVSQIMKEVGVNIITQKYLEPLLEKHMDQFMTYFDENNGVIGEEGLEIISQMYDAADKAAEITEGYLNSLEDIANKHGETIKDTSAASGSNVISGITEDEYGLLISYVNAMRADLSSDLMYNKRIAEEMFPQVINILAVHQANLIDIAENTRRSADAADRLNSTFDSLISGTKKLNVITYIKK